MEVIDQERSGKDGEIFKIWGEKIKEEKEIYEVVYGCDGS